MTNLEINLNGAKKRLHGISEAAKDEMREVLEETSYKLKKASHEMQHNMGKYMKRNPWRSLGIASLLGAALTLLIRR